MRMRYERSMAIAGRHGTLIELIRTGEFSTPALAAKLKVSEQTVYRDVLFLKQRGYVIRAVKHSAGWAYQLRNEPATGTNGTRSPST
jgi:DeoR/GlpR family transcriptional regulator of sugar metabolism